jgi:hypothetical protein
LKFYLSVKYKTKKITEEKDIKCSITKCELNIQGIHFWYSQIPELWTTSGESDERYLHFPTGEKNSIEIPTNIKNPCYEIEYRTPKNSKITLNIIHNLKNHKTRDTILSIKPSYNYPFMQTTTFCLRDFIAFDTIDSIISINVEQIHYNDYLDEFALRIRTPFPKEEFENWNVEKEPQYFLRSWKEENKVEAKSEWKIQIPSKVFKFTDVVEFTGIKLTYSIFLIKFHNK